MLQLCSVLASHWVKNDKFESVFAALASVFTLKITHAELVVSCINATAVFGNEGPALTFINFNLQRLKQNNNFFCKRL